MTALSPLAVSRDSDTTSDYESPQSDVVRTYLGPCMFLGQNSHDDSFVAIGGVTRQRHDQWLRKPPVRRCTNVFGSLYVFRSKQSRWQLCRHWRCHETATRPVITKAPSRQLCRHWLYQKETVSSTIKELSPWRLFAVLMLQYSWTCISK